MRHVVFLFVLRKMKNTCLSFRNARPREEEEEEEEEEEKKTLPNLEI